MRTKQATRTPDVLRLAVLGLFMCVSLIAESGCSLIIPAVIKQITKKDKRSDPNRPQDPNARPSLPKTMMLVSNQENTEFFMRPRDGKWERMGKAKILEVPVEPGKWYEVRAEPPDYVVKTIAVQAPKRELRFTFLVEDLKRNQPENQVGVVDVDVYAVSIETGKVVDAKAHGNSRGVKQGFDKAMTSCAEQLAEAKVLRDKCVAVLRFREGRNAEGLGNHAKTKLTWRLITHGVNVMEREKLKRVMDERNLTESQIVRDPKRLAGLVSAEFLLLGDISVLKD